MWYNANMGKLKSVLVAFINWLTMKNARHNRALRDILDLQKTVEEFLAKYRLQEDGPDFKLVFANIGQARIDVTEIAHLTGTRVRIAQNIEGEKLPPLIEEVHSDLDDFKRALFTRTLGSVVLSERVLKVHKSLENLLAAASDIEYK
jgi:hypothetical protein